MQAELSRAGEYVGVALLTEDGVTVDLEDPAQKEEVERVFRDASAIDESAAGETEEPLLEFSHLGDRRWFEEVLRSLGPKGYTFEMTKTDNE
jgi:hypothetical protein